MRKISKVAIVGAVIGILSTLYVVIDAFRLPDPAMETTVPFQYPTDAERADIVSQSVVKLTGVLPDDAQIYANHGPDTLVTGSIPEAELDLQTDPDIIIKGPSSNRAILTVGLNEDLHEYATELREQLDNTKKQSYARYLLIDDGSVEIANWVTDKSDGTVTVETLDNLENRFRT